MIDLNILRKNPDQVERGAASKNIKIPIKEILNLDSKNRNYITQIEKHRAQLRSLSRVKPDKKTIKNLKDLGNTISRLQVQQKDIERKFSQLLYDIPALPKPDVKLGKDEKENEIVKRVGEETKFSFPPKDYMELSVRHDLIDIKRAVKVSGSRFGYIKNELALLEVALIQYAFDRLVGEGHFIPFFPPVMISEKAMDAMGYLQHGGEDETYHLEKDKLYLIGTSEQSLGPYHMDEILDEKSLPLRYCAFSSCFRREAGASGKDTTGILRVHQFDKIEMFVFCKPNDSDKEHEYLLSLEEKFVSELHLPYQVVKMCTGDLGMPAARKYDIECFMASQKRYRETHSTSNCVDFQARRLNIRYKDLQAGENQFIHTLNGTAFALGRTMIMILENYQQKDGSIKIPEVLQKYMNGLTVIKS